MKESRLVELSARAPELSLLTAASDLEHDGRDWARRWKPAPLVITQPASVEAMPVIVHWVNQHGVAMA